MTNLEKDAYLDKNGDINTRTYRGPDRRRQKATEDDVQIYQEVVSNAKGDLYLDVRTNARRRREDDMTVNLLKCLQIDELDLDDSFD